MMPPPQWAYQVDHFDPAPDDELICSICRAVFCDPVQCSCNHVFCRGCINKWLDNNRNCPICRCRASRSSLQEVIPLIKNMIMKLQMRCHNVERGCTDRFSLESCETHVRDCSFELIRCKNRPCKEMHLRKDIRDHEQNSCVHHYIRCKTCGLKISTKVRIVHDCVKSLKAKVKENVTLIKKKNKKIQELQSELKSLREADRDSSISSDSSHSGIDLSFSPVSLSSWDNSSVLYSPSDADDYPDWLFLGDDVYSRHSNSQSHNSLDIPDISLEAPRSAEAAGEDSSRPDVSCDSTFDEESPIRRPAKRRLTSRILDSTDEECDEFEPRMIPSPKRNWPLHWDDNPNSHSTPISFNSDGEVAGTSSQSTRPHLLEPSSDSDIYGRLRPRVRNRAVTALNLEENIPIIPPTAVFEATLAMLREYNIESDPEWLPPDHSASNVLDIESESSLDTNSETSDDDHTASSDDSDSLSSEDSDYKDCSSRLPVTNIRFSIDNLDTEDSEDEWLPI